MGRTYKRRSKSLEATALEIIVTDTGNTALKLEVPGCKDYVALRLNRHEVKKIQGSLDSVRERADGRDSVSI